MRRPFAESAIACALAAAVVEPTGAQVRQAMAEAQAEVLAEAADDNFGWCADTAGDVNGDGRLDSVVGAIYNDSGAKDAGEAYIYLGGATFPSAPFVSLRAVSPTANDQFGVSCAGAGDVNGDGYADVIVGARLSSLGGASSGAAFIFFGGPAMDGIADVILAGEASHDWFGNSVDGAGDVNEDGSADVVVGAPYSDLNGSAAGAAYVFFGGAAMDAVADVVMAGEMSDDQFGWSVAGAGDVDGDGRGDVVVGARLHCVDAIACTGPRYARGRAYVFLGSAVMDAAPDLVLEGDAANDWFGNTVAGVGDVNGDGFDDVAVGAIYADPIVGGAPLTAAGTTSLYLGGQPVDATRDALIAGEQANGQSGWAIAGAGDADGDGFADLLTTEHFYDDGVNTGAGKVYLLAGGLTTGARRIAVFVGDGQDVQLGQSASGADIAGTGSLADVVLGQVYSRDAGPGSGKAILASPICLDLAVEGPDLSWSSCVSFASFNLYRGGIEQDLRTGSYGSCLATGLAGGSTSFDPATPALGEAYFYLMTGREAFLEGGLGFTSAGDLRPNIPACP